MTDEKIENEISEFAKKLQENENEPLLSREKNQQIPRNLSTLQKLSFGLGHVINDILGVLWFSYALIFLQIVARIPPTISALLMFLGQFTDAAATPFIGILIDKFGSKKRWNAAGVILIASSFPFIFHNWNDALWYMPFYYILPIIIFQIGWATVQISHLSMIPDMTIFLQERAELTSLRYIIFVCSNITIYIVAYFILQESKMGALIEPRDGWKFEVVAIIAVSIGVICSIFFQSALKVPPTQKKSKSAFNTAIQTWRKLYEICSSSKLYLVAFIHTTSRLFHSLNLTYIPFLINETNMKNSGILAGAPFFNFTAALLSSVIVNLLSKKYVNNKIMFTAGTTFALLSCVCVYLDPSNSDDAGYIYSASVFCGIGSAMTVITSLCIAANYIGKDTEYGAFIYGLITFSDKILTGLIIFSIESLKSSNIISSEHYYKFVLTFVNATLTMLGYIFLLLLPSSVCYST
ncbi:major facilitator superfamily domain-containing protein 12-like [Planococcus citri]|uniref:major facilitator superfamily domain-containing protein 12-like n=1 Tax=Planococcus citri TaxID=170843 RepID=UPI0031F880A3